MLKFIKKRGLKKTKIAMMHAIYGKVDGVSIVMNQIENSLIQNSPIQKKNITYLVGNKEVKNQRVFANKIFSYDNELITLIKNKYTKGLTNQDAQKIESAISKGIKIIRKFVYKNKIDIIISHNFAYPVNLIMSVSLSRFFQEEKQKGKKIPKHILWWHDSHLERKTFSKPAPSIKKYLIEGNCGPNVDSVIFINSTQFKAAKKYFKEVDKKYPGTLEKIEKNHEVIYNTAKPMIKKFSDLEQSWVAAKYLQFIKDFHLVDELRELDLNFAQTLFCLQGTRIVDRKRIDFALKYLYKLLDKLSEDNQYQAIYFLISGHDADNSRKEIEKLNKELAKKYNQKKFMLRFAQDYYGKTKLNFFDYPLIFAGLGGIGTYFSQVEGFGNNLLEYLSAGLPTLIYKYPIYKTDIEKFKFNLIELNKFTITQKSLNQTINILKNYQKKSEMVNHNLKILKENLSHQTIFKKLKKFL